MPMPRKRRPARSRKSRLATKPEHDRQRSESIIDICRRYHADWESAHEETDDAQPD